MKKTFTTVSLLFLFVSSLYASGGAWGNGLLEFIIFACAFLLITIPAPIATQIIALVKSKSGNPFLKWLIPGAIVIVASLGYSSFALLNPWNMDYLPYSGHLALLWSTYIYILFLSSAHALLMDRIFIALSLDVAIVTLFNTEGAIARIVESPYL